MNRYATADQLWLDALLLPLSGDRVSPRGKMCYETRGVTLVLDDPTQNVVTHRTRRLNYHFMVAEWLWVLHGLSDVTTIAGYNKSISAFSDDNEKFFGAYGPRIRRDLLACEELLRRDHATRQAVMLTWRPEALWMPTKDVPCTLTWQFFIRKERLELHVSMRSNDVWLGLPYDLYNFTQIQRQLAARLDVGVGPYYHHVGSLHLYEQNIEKAQSCIWDASNVLDVGASPAPYYYTDAYVLEILEGLPRNLGIESARSLLNNIVMPPWKPFVGVLLHRFSKEYNDLDAYFTQVIV